MTPKRKKNKNRTKRPFCWAYSEKEVVHLQKIPVSQKKPIKNTEIEKEDKTDLKAVHVKQNIIFKSKKEKTDRETGLNFE